LLATAGHPDYHLRIVDPRVRPAGDSGRDGELAACEPPPAKQANASYYPRRTRKSELAILPKGAFKMRTSVAVCGVLGTLGFLGTLLLTGGAALAEGKFEPLFDGKTLNGWQGDKELWRVEDGEIVGSTENQQLKRNSFLSTTKSY